MIRGGKVAMSVALGQNSPKDLISHLIVVDIAPTKGVPSFDFRSHAIAVIQIQNDQVKSREEADKILAEVEPVRFRLSTTLVLKSLTIFMIRIR